MDRQKLMDRSGWIEMVGLKWIDRNGQIEMEWIEMDRQKWIDRNGQIEMDKQKWIDRNG